MIICQRCGGYIVPPTSWMGIHPPKLCASRRTQGCPPRPAAPALPKVDR